MKGRKAFSLLVLCVGLIWVFCGHAQEEPEVQEQEVSQEVFIPGAEDSEQEVSSDVFIPGSSEQPAEQTQETIIEEEQPQEEAPEIQPEQVQPEATQETQPVQDEQQPQTAPEDQETQTVITEESVETPVPAEQEVQPDQAQEATQLEQQEPEPEQEEDVPMPPDEVMGLDTVDLENPQGNWLFKRVWWERAEAKYEKIKEVVNQVMEKRTAFFAQRSDLDKNVLDPFYIHIGFRQGELEEIIKNLIAQLKSKEEVSQAESDSFSKIQDDKKELESLSQDVQKVQKNDEAVDKALLQLVDQINKLRSYEQQAWKDFKSIARVLDDKKARELFYSVDNAWQNVQRIKEYLEQTFSSSFEKLVKEVKEGAQHIASRVDELKNRDILLKTNAQGADEESDEDGDTATQKPGKIAQFVSMITDGFKNLYNLVVSIVRWPLDLIFGKPAQEEPADMGDEVTESEQTDEEPAAVESAESSGPAMPAQEPEIAPEEQNSPLQQPEPQPEQVDIQEEMMESTEPSDQGEPHIETEQEVNFAQEEPIADQPENILEPEIEQE